MPYFGKSAAPLLREGEGVIFWKNPPPLNLEKGRRQCHKIPPPLKMEKRGVIFWKIPPPLNLEKWGLIFWKMPPPQNIVLLFLFVCLFVCCVENKKIKNINKQANKVSYFRIPLPLNFGKKGVAIFCKNPLPLNLESGDAIF